ncbi:MAG: zinc metalloprotease HtpX [Egibacteraceae bacterium]
MLKSFKTFVLLAALSGLMLFVGQGFGGSTGLTIALVLALVMNVGTYWFSDKLAIKMARGREASEAEYPWYHALVRELSMRAGKPMPRLYVSPSPQPNAFATGRNPQHAAVCVNQGLIDILDRDEMEGVLAHELSHVYNRDILIGTIAATIATAITFLARLAWFIPIGGSDNEGRNPFGQLLMLLLAPVAAMLIQFAVTRSRETQADASGAHLCGKPLALASALQKLETQGKARARLGGTPAETSPAFQSLYISAPFGGAAAGLGNLFRTHPKTDVRVANLRHIAQQMGQIA